VLFFRYVIFEGSSLAFFASIQATRGECL